MKQILILSGKGGTGKTTIASNFINISKAKIFADCDVEAPNLHLISMVKNLKERENYYGLDKSVIDQEQCLKCGICYDHCKFNAIVYKDNQYKIDLHLCEGCGVCNYVCPQKAISFVKSIDGELLLYKDEDRAFSTAKLNMGSGNSGLLVTRVKKNIHELIRKDDLVIIDGPPGIGCPVIASMSGVNLVLLVAEPSLSGISDLKRIIKTASSFHLKIAVCINKYDLNKKLTQSIIEYLNINNYSFVGLISYDKEIIDYINLGKPLLEGSKPYKEIKKVFDNTISLIS
jgi:MinD superfamily P-loop ATPase